MDTKISEVIFDLDNTLFDTESIKTSINNLVEIHGFSQQEIIHNLKKKEGQVTLKGVLQEIETNLNTKKISSTKGLALWEKEIEEDARAISGAEELLETCLRSGLKMYLLTLGKPTWQKRKVELIKIDKYFEEKNIFITDDSVFGKTEKMLQIFGSDFDGATVAVFNDKPDEVLQILKKFPKVKVFLRREIRDMRYKEKDFSNIANDFPGQVFWSEDLKKLNSYFLSFI